MTRPPVRLDLTYNELVDSLLRERLVFFFVDAGAGEANPDHRAPFPRDDRMHEVRRIWNV